jgi:hypothetical protein
MRFEGDPDDDDSILSEKVYLVKQSIAHLLRRGLKQRRSVFF